MKNKLLMILKLLVICLISGCMVYYIFFAEEVEHNNITRCAIILAGYLLSMTRAKRKPLGKIYRRYEKAYKDILEGSFSGDKRNYRKLLDVAVCYNREQFDKAHKLLDELLKVCINTKDYIAVYTFRGLCYADAGNHEQAVQIYEKTVQYDMTNSMIWSNLGVSYMELGRVNDAYNAYSNAILYNSEDAYLYNNMAHYFIKTGEPEKALTYSLKAIELDSKVYDAMGMCAMAYKMLGENDNAEKYCKMYGANGGDAQNLRKVLAKV